jgi:uncharacterized protein YigE (DUF2233 family)
MNRNLSYFIILILALNILGAIWLLNSVRASRAALERTLQAQDSTIRHLQTDLRVFEDSLFVDDTLISSTVPAFFPFLQTIWFKNKLFDICVIDTKTCNIELFLKDETGAPLLSFDRLGKLLASRQAEMLFAMNAGMYQPDYQAQGLFVSKGKQLQELDLKDGEGNFYLKPNGVFYLDKKRTAHVMTTQEFRQKQPQAYYATQSGPMLVINNRIHPAFTRGSRNKYIRSGVGVIDPDHIVFIISNKPVNFFDFATLFRDYFGCPNALYLDGAISEMYLPSLKREKLEGNFGPLIGIMDTINTTN